MKKNTVIVDIEAFDVRPWQNFILKNINDVFSAKEMMIISSGRQSGKSLYYSYLNNLCKEIVLPMEKKPKYQFSRAQWYTAKRPGGWNHLGKEYHGVLEWCVENFGPHPKQRDAWSRWFMSVDTVVFRDEKDYVLFQLKWA